MQNKFDEIDKNKILKYCALEIYDYWIDNYCPTPSTKPLVLTLEQNLGFLCIDKDLYPIELEECRELVYQLYELIDYTYDKQQKVWLTHSAQHPIWINYVNDAKVLLSFFVHQVLCTSYYNENFDKCPYVKLQRECGVWERENLAITCTWWSENDGCIMCAVRS